MNRLLPLFFAVVFSCTACAKDDTPAKAAEPTAAPVAAAPVGNVDANIRAAMKKLAPNAEVDAIAESAIPGLYQVTLGAQVVYLSGDGKYLLQGSMFDTESRTDLTEKVRQVARKSELSKVPATDMISFAPENPKHRVTVFTDIDCGYCRKLHEQIKGYNDLGIAVDYLFFPRAGVGSESFAKAEGVWCAKNKQAALTNAKLRNQQSNAKCDSPVAAHYALGNRLGVSGTPAMVTTDGSLIPGYQPPARLLQTLEQAK